MFTKVKTSIIISRILVCITFMSQQLDWCVFSRHPMFVSKLKWIYKRSLVQSCNPTHNVVAFLTLPARKQFYVRPKKNHPVPACCLNQLISMTLNAISIYIFCKQANFQMFSLLILVFLLRLLFSNPCYLKYCGVCLSEDNHWKSR